jgi:hypothetical protein
MTTTDIYVGASSDTMIYQAAPTTNYGAGTAIYVGEVVSVAGAAGRTLIKWDQLSDGTIKSNSVVLAGTLSIMPYDDRSTNARTIRVFRPKRAWVVGEATWNIWATGQNWSTAGGFHADDCEQTDIGNLSLSAAEDLNVYKDITLTPSKLQEYINGTWANNGFLIKADTETDDCYFYRSTNYATENNRPKLTIVYSIFEGNPQVIII